MVKHLHGTPPCITIGKTSCGSLSSSLRNDTLSKQNCLAWGRRSRASSRSEMERLLFAVPGRRLHNVSTARDRFGARHAGRSVRVAVGLPAAGVQPSGLVEAERVHQPLGRLRGVPGCRQLPGLAPLFPEADAVAFQACRETRLVVILQDQKVTIMTQSSNTVVVAYNSYVAGIAPSHRRITTKSSRYSIGYKIISSTCSTKHVHGSDRDDNGIEVIRQRE
ncbi:hypothetical protein ON010_g3356 [Phytophthora cinnamomi]|nr:hypothetical protein ON010_g3356 [Phytophthora cinnamomi]